MDSDQTGLSIEQVMGVVRRRALMILLCFVVVAGAAYGFSRHQTKKYTATASLVFNNNQLNQQVAGLQAVNLGNQLPQQQTNRELVQLGETAERTAKRLNNGLTRNEIKGSLSVNSQGESNIVEVSSTSTSPTLAARIANTYTRVFVEDQQNNNRKYYGSALALVNKQLAALSPKQKLTTAGLTLQDRAQTLTTLAELQSGNVEIAQAATVPISPSSPKIKRNTLLGALLGLIIGLGVALLLERLDRKIREPKDLEAIYHLPLLGVVPESAALSGLAGRRSGAAKMELPSSDAEAFHLIRAHLRYFNVDKQLRTLMVASAAPGDGKTTVARHLAAAAARMGSRVLIVEADLRRPTMAQQLDIKSGPGVADVLIGSLSFDDALQSVDLDSLSREGGRSLDVLVAGASLPPNPGELIESHAMEALLEQAKAAYDLVVIDTPPLTAVSDAFPLLGKVDGVIIVGRVGRNRRDVAQRLHETVTGAGAPLLGVVANGFRPGALGSYAYDYSYASDRSEDSSSGSSDGDAPLGPGGTDSPLADASVPTKS